MRIAWPHINLTVVKAMQLFQIMRQGAVILVSILLAKSTLSQGAIGHFEMLLFIGFSFTSFWVSGLLQAILPLFPDLDQSDQKSLFFNVYLLAVALSLLVYGILFFGDESLTQWLVGEAKLPYFQLYAAYLLVNTPTFLLEYFYLLQKRPRAIVTFGAFSFALHVLVILLPVFAGYGLEMSFYGLLVLALAKHIWTLAFVLSNGRLGWRSDLLGRHLHLMFPLVLFALLSGLTSIFDNWLVGWFFEDEATFAIFRFGARELPLVTALTGAFSASLIPEIASDLPTALTMIRQKSVKLFHLLFPISGLLLLSSAIWFPLLFNESFAPSAGIFNIYLLVLISRMVFTHTILIGLKKTKIVLYISIIEVSTNIILSLFLVRIWGMEGIAMATVVAFSLEKILTMIYLYRTEGISPRDYLNLRWFGVYSILLLVCFIIRLL